LKKELKGEGELSTLSTKKEKRTKKERNTATTAILIKTSIKP